MGYTEEMKALEDLMIQAETNEAAERTNVSQGNQIANSMFMLTKPSQGPASLLLGARPQDRSEEMKTAWTGRAQSRLTDVSENKKRLLEQYKELKDKQKFEGDQEYKTTKLGLEKTKIEQDQANKLKELAQKDEELKIKRQELASKAGTNNDKPLAGEVAVDRKFAGSYNDYINEGGAVTIQTNLDKMENVLDKLKSGEVQTGGMWAKFTPVTGKTGGIANPTLLGVKEELESAIQNTLRPILGGQFAMVEGQQIMSRAFNPSLPTKTNIAKIEAEIRNLKNRAKVMNESVAYYEKNGTLKGYKGGDVLKTLQPSTNSTTAKGIEPKPGLMNEAVANTPKIDYSKLTDDQLAKMHSERIGGR